MLSDTFSAVISRVTRAAFAQGSALDIVHKAEYQLRPWLLKAMYIDTKAQVVYVAVEHPQGYTFAAIAEYSWDNDCLYGVHMDFDCDETEGPCKNMRSCWLNVIEALSPLSDFPDVDGGDEYSQARRQRAKDWRLTCLRKIIRSRTSSDADKASARELLTATRLA